MMMMRSVVGGLLALAMVFSCPGGSVAEETDSQEGAYRLAEIVVSGESESIAESAGTVHRITARDIQDQGARTLDEALELVPGLIVREGAEGSPRIDIRGFRTRHVQLFLNGIPVVDTYDGQFDPTLIPAEIISEIKVTTGGGSVLYGPGGNGGAIDIITKSGKRGLHGTVGGEIGEGERYLGKASLSGGGEKADFYLGVNAYDRDKFTLSRDFDDTDAEGGDYRANSDRERTSLFGNTSYRLGERTQLGLTVSHTTGENGKPAVTNSDDADPFTKSPKYERIDDLETSLVQVAIDHKTAGPFEWRGWGFFSQSEIEENRYDDDTYSTQDKKGAYHQNTDMKIYGASTQLRYHVGTVGNATLGLTAENDEWDVDGFSVGKSSTEDYSDERDIQIYSVALEYEHQLGDRAGIVVGYGHHFQDKDSGGSDDDFSYLVGVSYDLTDATRVKANHARKIRFPSVKQLYDGDSANPDLDTEVTLHYEAGIRQMLPYGMSLGVTGFIIRAEDFIEKDESDPNEMNKNYQDLRFHGVETDLIVQPIDALRLRLAVGWLETEDRSDDSERDELQHRPEWTVSVDGRYRFDFGLTASASLKYVADQYFYDQDDEDPLEKKKLNDFTVVNVKLSQKIVASGLEIYVGADNLFDEDYEESYGLPQPGQTVYGGVEYRF
ncbi:TonB-dependent receptor [Desulfosarcina ovata subsp. sediminis]|uniref:TonB-dependent receptor n=2 Tax=Desulfosarcina ovata TaxID=83564 RepID=A0A5K8A054_9BACT|nr:TonB-dependent receptor [Desulfosarcina ovata subsp. sediminis]